MSLPSNPSRLAIRPPGRQGNELRDRLLHSRLRIGNGVVRLLVYYFDVCLRSTLRNVPESTFAPALDILSKLGAGTENEILNVLLRLGAFVEMFVAGENNIDSVLHKERLQHLSQFQTGAMFLTRRVQRVMEERDFPFAAGTL